MRKNDDFPINETFTRGTSIKATCNKDLTPVFEEMAKIEEEISPLLISMLGKEFSFNGEIIDGEEYFKGYCSKKGIDCNKDFFKLAKSFADEFFNASQSKAFSTLTNN